MLSQEGVRRYAKLAKGSVMELAVNLDADIAVYGEFTLGPPATPSSKGQVTIRCSTANLKAMRRGVDLEETGPLESLSAIQTKLAYRVLTSILPAYPKTEQDFLNSYPPVRVDALENYIRGLLAPATDVKLRLFSQAARLDPGFSQPAFQLGRLSFQRKDYKGAAEWLQKVRPYDARYREALFLLGISRYETGEYPAAAQAFQSLANEVPLGSVLNNLGLAQLRAGDSAMLASLEKAIEADPADPDARFNFAYALWRKGAFGAATEQFRAVLQRVPGDENATLLLGRCIQNAGPRPGDVRTEGLERLKRNYDETAWRHLKAMLGQPQND